jgi:hypothetical protein
MLPRSITAHKADSFDGWMITDGIHGGHCTMDDIKDTWGKAWAAIYDV